MSAIITFVLENFPAVCLVLAFLLAIIVRRRVSFGESLTKYLLLLPVGFGGIWGYYYHAFDPIMSAKLIGWAPSPFQFEIAVANLGMGFAGIVGFCRKRDYSLAVAIMVSCFLWGAAFGHIREIFQQGNYSSDNAGIILYTDILIPCSLWLGYFLWMKREK